MQIAKRDDWKTEPFPAAFKQIVVERSYSQEEFCQITAGLIPEEMDDKWFIFYDAPWLYLHRSWTGFCIFKVCFEPEGERIKVCDVYVNRESTQYKGVDDRQDVSMLEILLDRRAGQDTRNQMQEYIKRRHF